MNVNELFISYFGSEPSATSHAYGRVNLIGEHIDYNGGIVLPTQIDRVVEIAISHGEAQVRQNFLPRLSKNALLGRSAQKQAKIGQIT